MGEKMFYIEPRDLAYAPATPGYPCLRIIPCLFNLTSDLIMLTWQMDLRRDPIQRKHDRRSPRRCLPQKPLLRTSHPLVPFPSVSSSPRRLLE